MSIKLFIKFSYGGIASAFLSFVSTPLITAIILPEHFGKASLVLLSYSLLINFVQLGADQSFVRFYSTNSDDEGKSKLFANAIILPVFFATSIILLFLPFNKDLGYLLLDEPDPWLYVILSFLLIIGLVERFSTLNIRMEQRASLFSNLKILQSIVNISTIFLFSYYFNKSYKAIVIGMLISTFTVAIIGILCSIRPWKGIFNSLSFEEIKRIFSFGLPFVPTFLISFLFEAIDKIALKYYSNFSEIGLYSAALKIVSIISLIQIAFSSYWAPISYQAFEDNDIDEKKILKRAFSYLSAILFPISIIVIYFNQILIKIVSIEYSDASSMIPFLIFTPVLYTLSDVTMVGINFKKKTLWHLWIAVISFLFNLFFVTILVPLLGGIGASLASSISYLIFFYLRTNISKRLYFVDYSLYRAYLGITLIYILAFIAVFFPNSIYLHITASLFFIALIYLHKTELFFLGAKSLKLLKT